jgi:hypothetical protein
MPPMIALPGPFRWAIFAVREEIIGLFYASNPSVDMRTGDSSGSPKATIRIAKSIAQLQRLRLKTVCLSGIGIAI